MPIEMDYTFHGANHPNSWWVMAALNLNLPAKTATIVMHGFHDKEALEADPSDVLDIQLFTCTDPDVFDFYFGQINRNIDDCYVTVIETYLWIGSPDLIEITTFFSGAIGVFSPIDFVSALVGETSNSIVQVAFTDDVFNGGNFTNGVTIKVNGSPVGISSAAQPADLKVVKYTLTAPVGLTDVVTFEYDFYLTGGTIVDAGAIGLYRIPAKPVTNLVGGALWFDDASNSIWLGVF
jgi:hypothetical protein